MVLEKNSVASYSSYDRKRGNEKYSCGVLLKMYVQ